MRLITSETCTQDVSHWGIFSLFYRKSNGSMIFKSQEDTKGNKVGDILLDFTETLLKENGSAV